MHKRIRCHGHCLRSCVSLNSKVDEKPPANYQELSALSSDDPLQISFYSRYECQAQHGLMIMNESFRAVTTPENLASCRDRYPLAQQNRVACINNVLVLMFAGWDAIWRTTDQLRRVPTAAGLLLTSHDSLPLNTSTTSYDPLYAHPNGTAQSSCVGLRNSDGGYFA